jgi:hypothetical protein
MNRLADLQRKLGRGSGVVGHESHDSRLMTHDSPRSLHALHSPACHPPRCLRQGKAR